MGKNKLAKFQDIAGYPHVFHYPGYRLREEEMGFELKGRWKERFFKNTNPIVLELGCGKGEYTVGLGRLFPEKNFIGVDVKRARMWSGAKESLEAGMTNVAFLRTHIEWITSFFAPGEVEEIWLTFPSPQMQTRTKRLTSSAFLARYCRILRAGGVVHLKTDSRFMHAYTTEIIKANRLPLLFDTDNLYHNEAGPGEILSIRTYYERQWLRQGLSIRYTCFVCEAREVFVEPNM